ncbi:fasciclin domain-containing protein [Fibrisoma montanum]|uniref:Fasciclin domain-containing protein n=1 Tax=Fibrisoma montanum TaxID=2305895 RepID=A0A418M6Y1_9BACT|nr:fasciclin domain-containing protein [Fibrisoma montanum]RIV21591.1 fasciclin domain-containing protein [Fibrisoma montanum]
MHIKSSSLPWQSGLIVAALFTLFVFGMTACSNDDDDNTPATANIAELVATNAQFTLLNAALARAGLDATLRQAGPFTVFAPTDDAFRAAGFANVAAVTAADQNTLRNILLYHVVGGSVPASAINTGQTAQPTSLSANGTVYISKAASTSGTSTGVSVNGARVVQADVAASNGVIHVIDKVLLPPTGSILAVVQADTSLSLLTAAALRGGTAVTGALSNTATALTVFAPTNAAFRATSFSSVAAITAAPEAALANILTYHVIPLARAYSPTLTNGAVVTTFQTGTVTVGVSSTAVTVTGRGNGGNPSRVTTADINATNGVVHKIDRVLLP